MSDEQLPTISWEEAVRVFEKDGWSYTRHNSNHFIMKKPGMRFHLSVPKHRSLKKGTLRKLIRVADMSVQRFVSLL